MELRRTAERNDLALSSPAASGRPAGPARADKPEEAFTVSIPCIIRPCRRDDLDALEWFGRFTEHREIIQKTYAAQARGDQFMLVAEMNGAPVGQVWIDLVRLRERRTGFLWAVRVFPWFQRLGIGGRLLAAAEQALVRRGFAHAELGVETENTPAARFYERHGYRRVGRMQEEYRYTTPAGVPMCIPLDEWVYRKALVPGA